MTHDKRKQRQVIIKRQTKARLGNIKCVFISIDPHDTFSMQSSQSVNESVWMGVFPSQWCPTGPLSGLLLKLQWYLVRFSRDELCAVIWGWLKLPLGYKTQPPGCPPPSVRWWPPFWCWGHTWNSQYQHWRHLQKWFHLNIFKPISMVKQITEFYIQNYCMVTRCWFMKNLKVK